jgi:kynurenine formamidase
MTEIIDLSQDIFEGMPVFKDLPQVKISIHKSHEEWEGTEHLSTRTPVVHKLELGEHTGTHVDAINHVGRKFVGKSIDTMPLSTFYTDGVCLDFAHKNFRELIEPEEVQQACDKSNLEINAGNTILLYTNHCRKAFQTENWGKVRVFQRLRQLGWRRKGLPHLESKRCRQEFRTYQTERCIVFAGK